MINYVRFFLQEVIFNIFHNRQKIPFYEIVVHGFMTLSGYYYLKKFHYVNYRLIL